MKKPKLPLRPFSSWNEDIVRTDLGLMRTRSLPTLNEWMASTDTPAKAEREAVEVLRGFLLENVESWNEDELKFKFLGPLMQIIQFDHEDFRTFTQPAK